MKYPVLAIMLVFFSCNSTMKNDRKMNDRFPREIEIFAKKIEIKEVLNPTNIVKLEDFLVIQNEYISGEDCFYIYSLDKMKFCYSFGKLGQGVGEFIAPRIVQNNKGNSLSIFDSASDKIFTFNINQKEHQLIDEKKIIDNANPTQDISYVNDSILLYLVTGNSSNKLFSYNINTKNIIDTLEFNSGFKQKMKEKYNSNLDFYNFTNYGRKFVVGFNFINEIKVGNLNEEYKFEVKGGDKLLNSNFLPFTNEKMKRNYFYYMFPSASSNYIYAPYNGMEFIYLQPFPINLKGRRFNKYIEIYDWNVKPIARVKLDNDIIRLCVDEKRNKIYTWNPLENFDCILVYSSDFVKNNAVSKS